MINLDTFKSENFFCDSLQKTVPVFLVTIDEYPSYLAQQSDFYRKQVKNSGFSVDAKNFVLIYNEHHELNHILAPYIPNSPASLLFLAKSLPASIENISLENIHKDFNFSLFAQLWCNENYVFNHYKKCDKKIIKLFLPEHIEKKPLYNAVQSTFWGRNAINLPAEECTPALLEQSIIHLAQQYHAKISVIKGSDLKDKGMNLIHAVGRGVSEECRLPRLIHLSYNSDTDYPHLALVGKGITFDTGGLNIKTGSSMNLMKKDMGGSACVIALAMQIMADKLPIKMDLIVPTAENNVSANAFRPSDIFTAYNKKTVEITNTDAEGRLILADALTYASQLNPDIMIDIATLTGAARTALGADLPAMFTDCNETAQKLYEYGVQTDDNLWRLPLYAPYAKEIKGTISDYINSPSSGMAGSITAALFLKEFIGSAKKWVHFDSYCWNKTPHDGRPLGGDVVPIRAIYKYIKNELC